MVRESEHFTAVGHPNVTAQHRTTFEITCEEDLSLAGSCIIAVNSEKGALDLSEPFSNLLRMPGSVLTTILSIGDFRTIITASGSPDLILTHETDLVWRRSCYTCERTIGIYSDHTAALLPREIISLLQQEKTLDIKLIVEADEDYIPPFPLSEKFFRI